MPPKEAKARIKINNLLQDSGWRLLDDSTGTANVVLENNVKITHIMADNMGEDYEKTTNGYADYLLLDEKGFPLIVLEAKSEDKNPLAGKEQARKYARAQNCGYVILSNGNLHYLWDIEKSNPSIITKFPTQQSIKNYSAYKPQPDRLINEKISEDYIVLTQKPNYSQVPEYQDPNTREQFIQTNKLRFLRKYQGEAVCAIQDSVRKGNEQFPFEMATGTGKTLAFLLPMFDNMSADINSIQGLIVTPTRELAIQITSEAKKLAGCKNLNILAAYGGKDIGVQLKKLKGKIHLIIATPGRLLDHLRRGTINLDKLKTLVLDEADQMLLMGFKNDIEDIIEKTSKNRQTLCFSATMSSDVKKMAYKYMKDPIEIIIKKEETTLKNIKQFLIETTDRRKQEDLCKVLDCLLYTSPSPRD